MFDFVNVDGFMGFGQLIIWSTSEDKVPKGVFTLNVLDLGPASGVMAVRLQRGHVWDISHFAEIDCFIFFFSVCVCVLIRYV